MRLATYATESTVNETMDSLVLQRSRAHWWFFIRPALITATVIVSLVVNVFAGPIASIAVLFVTWSLCALVWLRFDIRYVLGGAAILLIGLAATATATGLPFTGLALIPLALWWAVKSIGWWFTILEVHATGIRYETLTGIRPESRTIELDKIQAIDVGAGSLIEAWAGSGDLVIATALKTIVFNDIRNPAAIQRLMHDLRHKYEDTISQYQSETETPMNTEDATIEMLTEQTTAERVEEIPTVEEMEQMVSDVIDITPGETIPEGVAPDRRGRMRYGVTEDGVIVLDDWVIAIISVLTGSFGFAVMQSFAYPFAVASVATGVAIALFFCVRMLQKKRS